MLVVALLAPLLFYNQYALHIGVLMMFSVILATSFNLIVGYVGEFSLGHTAFLGVGAYTVALLSTRFGLPFHFAVIGAGVVAALFGLLIGAITLAAARSVLCDRDALLCRGAAADRQQLDRTDQRADGNFRH